jgi:hypothetical protein
VRIEKSGTRVEADAHGDECATFATSATVAPWSRALACACA